VEQYVFRRREAMMFDAGRLSGKRHTIAIATCSIVGLLSALLFMNETSTAAGGVSCGGEAATMVGDSNHDEIDGTPRRDVIHARGGNDEVDGHGGKDLICGGRGSDDLAGDGGRDDVRGGRGNDALDGNAGNDHLTGGRGFDDIDGGAGHDTCSGEHVEEC
jgi:Ca2+-binding RTX toxin-like protein